jgi:3-phenylpropionate/cinnamic acid dioxygenase small subunit
MVSNIRVQDVNDDEIDVKNNLVMHHARDDETQPAIISGERRDTIRRVDGELRLAKRTVYLDQTVMGTKNLSVIL